MASNLHMAQTNVGSTLSYTYLKYVHDQNLHTDVGGPLCYTLSVGVGAVGEELSDTTVTVIIVGFQAKERKGAGLLTQSLSLPASLVTYQ